MSVYIAPCLKKTSNALNSKGRCKRTTRNKALLIKGNVDWQKRLDCRLLAAVLQGAPKNEKI